MFYPGILNLRGKCRKCINHIEDFKLEVQQPKSALARQKTFVSISWITNIIPTNVNDIFIQPYIPNRTRLRWNRLYFLQVVWLLVDWRPLSGKFRPETQHFGNPKI